MTDQAFVEGGELAQQLRVDSIRCSTAAGSGHPTSSMSAADVMAVLLARHLHYDWDRPDDPTNDHLIFSKGHASPLLYSMFKAAGAITDEELMTGYRRFGSRLGGPSHAAAAVGRCGYRLFGSGASGWGQCYTGWMCQTFRAFAVKTKLCDVTTGGFPLINIWLTYLFRRKQLQLFVLLK